MPFRRLILVLAAAGLLSASNVTAGTYIVPVWARSVPGVDGTWWSQTVAINPNSFPVTLTVRGVYPLMTAPCEECSGAQVVFTLPPLSSRVITPQSGIPGRRLTAGAFEAETSAPLHLHTVAYRASALALRQRLDVAQRWLDAGRHAIQSVERGEGAWRVNVFMTNPADMPISVSAWIGDRSENEVTVSVGPRSTRMVTLPQPLCGGVPCTYPAEFPPRPLRLEVESSGTFMVSVSSVTPTWAVFSIAEEAL